MDLILGLMAIYALFWMLPRALADGVVTARAARAGAWDVVDRQHDRRAAAAARRRGAAVAGANMLRSGWNAGRRAWQNRRQMRHQQAGRTGAYRPGFKSYWSTLWTGFWEQKQKNLEARRAARPPYDPSKPTLWQRLQDATARTVRRQVQRLRDRRDRRRSGEPRARQPESGGAAQPEPAVGEPTTPAAPAPIPPPQPIHDAAPAPAPLPVEPRTGSGGEAPPPPQPRVPQHQVQPPAPNGTGGASQPQAVATEARSNQSIQGRQHMNMPARANGGGGGGQVAVNGTAEGVVSGAVVANQIRMMTAQLMMATIGYADQLINAIRQMQNSATQLGLNAQDMAAIAQALECLASFKQSVGQHTSEVNGSLDQVFRRWTAHLPGVDFNASVGGVAGGPTARQAYSGN